MSAQLIAFYAEPDDRAAFEKKYFDEHVGLVRQMPGLERVEIVRFEKNLLSKDAPPYYMMCTMSFASPEALKAAMGSPEGQAAGGHIMGFAGKALTMVTASTADAPVAV